MTTLTGLITGLSQRRPIFHANRYKDGAFENQEHSQVTHGNHIKSRDETRAECPQNDCLTKQAERIWVLTPLRTTRQA
ncbi:hypothetical protein IQ22_00215 [Pseudomonas duriflava]|uniref:Uncharacterized protein n=1 Tax=Pseudomonas duriflava TaxID=459528 RepID=A0A562QP32_9PSED|nr:hypothetical protein IQ22_00215 [Pseudomonas duriflava]